MFTFELLPRISETDGLGHINNTALPVWFEEARRGLFRIIHPEMSLQAWRIILKKYEIEFHHQIHYNHWVQINTQILKIGSKSMTVYQEAVQEGKIVASGTTVLVYFDFQTNRTQIIPNSIRSQLSPHLVDTPAPIGEVETED